MLYTPSYFKVDDHGTLIDFIKRHSFATIISVHQNCIKHLTKIPLLVKQKESNIFLEGHVAKANPHWNFLQDNPEVVTMFDGPHGYVSPTLYTDPFKNVPTWNYSTVVVKGKVEVLHSADWLLQSTLELAAKYEKDNSWKDNVDNTFVSSLTNGIVGIKIHVYQMEGKFKLSQNRDESTRLNIINQFEKTNPDLAEEMKKV